MIPPIQRRLDQEHIDRCWLEILTVPLGDRRQLLEQLADWLFERNYFPLAIGIRWAVCSEKFPTLLGMTSAASDPVPETFGSCQWLLAPEHTDAHVGDADVVAARVDVSLFNQLRHGLMVVNGSGFAMRYRSLDTAFTDAGEVAARYCADHSESREFQSSPDDLPDF